MDGRDVMLQGVVRRRKAQVAGLALACFLLYAKSSALADEEGVRTAHRMGPRPPGKPAYLWLWYADGTPSPQGGPTCTGFIPPAFTPPAGATLQSWQRSVQAYLDLWYADFNLVFSLTRPPTSDYYTVIITSDEAWCVQQPKEGGVAWGSCNDEYPIKIAYALQCGTNALACAAIIAHEHGHMVGLLHTTSEVDVMNRFVLPTVTGFEDARNLLDKRTQDDQMMATRCDRLAQNSYEMMLLALGQWQSGNKPSPAPSVPDAGAADATPEATPDAPRVGMSIRDPPWQGDLDGGGFVLTGFDALVRPPLQVPDAAPSPPSNQRSGCNLGQVGARSTPAVLMVLFALLLLRGLARISCTYRRT